MPRISVPTWAAAVMSAIVVWMVIVAPNSYRHSDPLLTLPLAQTILQDRTVKLDAYLTDPQPERSHLVTRVNNHYYYYFPLGPSLFSLPAVAVANLLGKDMRSFGDQFLLQDYMAALLCGFLFLSTYFVAGCFVRPWPALLITSVGMLGSTLISTLGTALWNLNFATLFVMLALLLVSRYETGRSATVHPFILGGLLFAAYFCRPTTAVFIALVFLYLLWKDWRQAALAGAAALVPLGLFALHSQLEYNLWLPPYYQPNRVGNLGDAPAPVVLWGLLFSPARGLFVYSPMFLVSLLGALALLWRRRGSLLLWIGLVWFLLHLTSIVRFWHWWGGHSYGPRLLTDVMPALLLLTLLVWKEMSQAGRRLRIGGAALFLTLGAGGIWLNVGGGLFNPYTVSWNGGQMAPNIDNAPQYLFRWDLAQFRASAALLCAKNEDYLRQNLAAGRQSVAPYHWGQALLPREALNVPQAGRPDEWYLPAALQNDTAPPGAVPFDAPRRLYFPTMQQGATVYGYFIGWEHPAGGRMWSACSTAAVLFGKPKIATTAPRFVLQFTAAAERPQRVQVGINGRTLDEVRIATSVQTLSVDLLTADLNWDGLNSVTFSFPDAVIAPNELQPRGIVLNELRLFPASTQSPLLPE